MEKFTVKRDDFPALQFEGECIAHNGTDPDKARGYSMKIYRTANGSYISECVGWSRLQGERTEYNAIVATHPKRVIKFFDSFGMQGFAHDALMELYREAGIEYVERIE